MGAGYIHKCDKCGYTVHTSGPWEFYRDSNGERKEYGHPTPFSKEAELCGISGLSGELYCPKCDQVWDLVLVEYKSPIKEGFLVWSGKYRVQRGI